jgi:hypothetical protein
MYISKYDVIVIGEKWNDKKEKHENGHTLVRLNSDDGILSKKFIPLLNELQEAHDGCEIEVSVIMKQRNYE